MEPFAGWILASRYQLVEPLGQGGMGEVWEATDLTTQRCVAIKFLRSNPGDPGFDEAKARFEQEAQSAWEVEHPNLIRIFAFLEQDKQPFLVMERLFGQTLAEHLEQVPCLGLQEAAEILLPVVSAVGLAHERGIVHRDLKPSNIFLLRTEPGAPPQIRVLDFGIAKWMPDAHGPRGFETNTGSTIGTPSYMAPEQATGEKRIDHRVDLWAIGVILYEVLSGVRPVEGQNAAQMVLRLLTSGIMPVEHLVPDLPDKLASLIGRLLNKNPDQRPKDLQEVFGALVPYIRVYSQSFGPPGSSVS